MINKAQLFVQQLDKAPHQSKKWKAFARGIYGIFAIFIFSILLILVRPAIANHIIALAQIAIGAYAGLVGVFLGAQGAVDYRNSAGLAESIK